MGIKPIAVELTDVETDFIESQKYMMQQIYSAFQIPKSMWGTDFEILQISNLTETDVLKAYDVALSFNHKIKVMGRNQTLKYLRCKRTINQK